MREVTSCSRSCGRRADTRPRRTDGAGLATSLDRGGGAPAHCIPAVPHGARVAHDVAARGLVSCLASHARVAVLARLRLKLVFYLIGATTVTIAGSGAR